MIRIREAYDIDPYAIKLMDIYHDKSIENFRKEMDEGRSFTIYNHSSNYTDKILACVNFNFKPHQKIAGINMLIDREFLRHKIEFIKVLRAGVVYFMQDLGLHRVHATIREDFCTAEGWIKILGFQKEGVLRKWGPDGENHILFSKVVA